MPTKSAPETCNCLALRQATRRVSQYYQAAIAPSGLRGTQFSILSRLWRLGPLGINALADELVVDRTTLARTLRPLQRAGHVVLRPGKDKRYRDIHITDSGRQAVQRALPLWQQAQAGFVEKFGATQAARLRDMLRQITVVMPEPRDGSEIDDA